MAPLNDQHELRSALELSVDQLYAAFAERKLSVDGPDACTACCASPRAMERMASAARRDITFDDLSEYLSTAKGPNAGQDLAYLLPRIMQVIAQGREPKCAGLFAVFAHYFPPMWSELTKKEREALARYVAALTTYYLTPGPINDWEFEITDVLEMLASGGFDTEPLTNTLQHPPPTVEATRILIDIILHHADIWRLDSRGFYETDDARSEIISTALRTALSSPDVMALLEAAALLDECEELAAQASLALQIAETMKTV